MKDSYEVAQGVTKEGSPKTEDGTVNKISSVLTYSNQNMNQEFDIKDHRMLQNYRYGGLSSRLTYSSMPLSHGRDAPRVPPV